MKKVFVILLALVIAIGMSACTAASSQTSQVLSETSSVTASVESVVSEVSSEETSSTESVVSETSETSEVSEPAESTETEVVYSDTAAALLEDFNAKRAELGKDALVTSDRLTKAAESYAQTLLDASDEFIAGTDFRTLPDGSKVTSIVNSVDSTEGRLTGLNYSVWVNEIPSAANTLEGLRNTILASSQFASKAEYDFAKIGIAAVQTVVDGVPQRSVVVFFYAA